MVRPPRPNASLLAVGGGGGVGHARTLSRDNLVVLHLPAAYMLPACRLSAGVGVTTLNRCLTKEDHAPAAKELLSELCNIIQPLIFKASLLAQGYIKWADE